MWKHKLRNILYLTCAVSGSRRLHMEVLEKVIERLHRHFLAGVIGQFLSGLAHLKYCMCG